MTNDTDKCKRCAYLEKTHARLTERLQLGRAYVEKFKESQDLDPKAFLAVLEKSAQELEDKLEKIRLEANALYKEIKRKK